MSHIEAKVETAHSHPLVPALNPELARAVKECIVVLEGAGLQLGLHFDLNNTILIKDSTSGHADIDGTLNETLGKCAMGVAVMCMGSPCWFPYLAEPFRAHGLPDEISWYEFQRKLTPNDSVLKPKAARFIENEGKYLRREFELMRVQGESVFVSYYVVQEAFKDVPNIFRSFGRDINLVVQELRDTGIIDPSEDVELFHNSRGVMALHRASTSRYFTASEFAKYATIQSGDRFFAVQEDYEWWKSNDKNPLHGKHICGVEGAFQIGFDDLDCMVADGRHAIVHRISTVEALSRPEYFVKLIVADILGAKARGEL
jgi:hypothetical protein